MNEPKRYIFGAEFHESDLIDWFELPADAVILGMVFNPNNRIVELVVMSEDETVKPRQFAVAKGGYHETLNKHVVVDQQGNRTVTWQ